MSRTPEPRAADLDLGGVALGRAQDTSKHVHVSRDTGAHRQSQTRGGDRVVAQQQAYATNAGMDVCHIVSLQEQTDKSQRAPTHTAVER